MTVSPFYLPSQIRAPLYAVYVRNSSLQRIAQVDDFQRLSMVSRFNEVGAWAIELEPVANAPTGAEPSANAATSLTTWGNGIIVTRDGTTIMSGPIRKINRASNAQQGESLVVSGVDDTTWLAERLALPVVTGPPYTASDHDVRTGAAETVIKQYVDNNAGPSAKGERQVPRLTIETTAGLGPSVTGRARFINLLALIQSLAIQGGGLGFRVVQVGTGLVFQVYSPTDRTATAHFALTFGNLRDFDYTISAPNANYFIVGGGGVGTARSFVEGGDSASIVQFGARIEQFRDRRDTTDLTEMAQTRDEELTGQSLTTDLRMTPVDTDGLSYLTNYALGDKVTVVIDGVPIQDIVREVTLELTNDQGATGTPSINVDSFAAAMTTARPSVGRVPLGGLAKLAPSAYAFLRKVGAQLSNLDTQ